MAAGKGTDEFVTKKALKGLVILILIGMFVQMGVIFYVFEQSYQGRKDLVDSQLAGCERGKLDRSVAIVVIRNVLQGFKETDQRNPEPLTQERRDAEKDLEDELPGLEERAHINCEEAFPKASLIP